MSRLEPDTDLSQNYKVLDENLKLVREKLNRPMTLSEKILYSHLDDPKTQVFAALNSLVRYIFVLWWFTIVSYVAGYREGCFISEITTRQSCNARRHCAGE